MGNETTQESIKDWFNKTYKLRGDQYLRPVRAYKIFPKILGLKKSEKILDVACGLGRLLEACIPYEANLYGVDISDVAVEKAKLKVPNALIQEGNAEHLDFEDGFFDHITCLGSLERMIDLNKVLSEIHRIGKKDAKFCFLVRNKKGFTWLIKKKLGIINKAGHQGAKSYEEWVEVFANNGYKVLNVYPDQYPIKKRQLVTTLGMGVDYEKISKAIIPMKYVHEYIFILSKA
jgi:ubiquinone/menaquinone biosynthesis C-methylase UbiE